MRSCQMERCRFRPRHSRPSTKFYPADSFRRLPIGLVSQFRLQKMRRKAHDNQEIGLPYYSSKMGMEGNSMEDTPQEERSETIETREEETWLAGETDREETQREILPAQRPIEMRTRTTIGWTLFWIAAFALLAWPLGLTDLLRKSLLQRGGDWLMGTLCLIWLLVLLKAPWDLYFQAREAAFEQERALERKITVPPGRIASLQRLQKRLGALAVGAHLMSAVFVVAMTRFAGGAVGYYFAAFYLIATLFRPLVAAYVYLSRKLFALRSETLYPREDVIELWAFARRQRSAMQDARRQIKTLSDALDAESAARREEQNALRQKMFAMSREFETTLTRLTDNQEILRGVQAFARLMAQAADT